MLSIVFYILLAVGAICGIISFIYIIQLGALIVRLNTRLGELVDILFVLGNRQQQQQIRRVDRSVENLPGHGRGLVDIPNQNEVTYDDRMARPITPNEIQSGTPVSPEGKRSIQGWDENI